MDFDHFREKCLALPHVEEDIKWVEGLYFLIGKKIFASTHLNQETEQGAGFKCTPESFAELTEREGIIVAPYGGARHHWVRVQDWNALSESEWNFHLRTAYELIFAKLTKRRQAELSR